MGIRKATARAAVLGAVLAGALAPAAAQAADRSLWKVYDRVLSKARYIDMTHRITPDIPVWKGFGPATFSPTVNPETGQPYTYANDGFEATAYQLATDQFGTQLDPPAHWDPKYPAIDELPPTYAVRPLVVISIGQAGEAGPEVRAAGVRHQGVRDASAAGSRRARS